MKSAVQPKSGAVNENTEAASTLSATPANKSTLLAQIMNQLGKVAIDDLSHFLNDTLAQIGHEADNIPDNAAAQNAATIATKEDVDNVLSGFELSEEIKEPIAAIFEAAVTNRLIIERAKLEEEYAAKLDEAVKVIAEDHDRAIDKYLTHTVNAWLEENRLIAEEGVKSQAFDELLEDFNQLVTKYNVKVNAFESKDVISGLEEQIASLTAKNNALLEEQIAHTEAAKANRKSAVVDGLVEHLTLVQKDKVKTLVEAFSYDPNNEDAFVKNVNLVIEKFVKEPASSTGNTGIVVEGAPKTLDEINSEAIVEGVNTVSPVAAAYARMFRQ